MNKRWFSALFVGGILFTLLGSVALAQTPTHFTFTANTGNEASVAILRSANPNIGGTPLSAGDEIGAFTPAGLCVGATVWPSTGNALITVWGDNSLTPGVIDGIAVGETISYRVWQASTTTEYSGVSVTYSLGNGVYAVDGYYVISLFNVALPPAAPTGVAATPGNGQVTISWDLVGGAISYNLYMATQTGVTKSNYATLPGGMQHTNVTSPYSHTGLINGTAYYFVVTAVNAAGESSESTEISATPVGPEMQLSTATVSIGSVERGSSGTASFTVTNVASGTLSITNITSDNPQFTAAPTNFDLTAGGSQTVTVTFTPTAVGLQNGTLTITHNAAGSPASVAVSGTGTDTTPPGTPAGLTATPGDGQVTLNWTANGEADLSYYVVYRAGADSIGRVNRPATSFTNTGLTNGETYSYWLAAVDDAGNKSGVSASVSVTLMTNEPTAQPTALTFSNITGTSLTVSFTASPSASDYLVLRKTGSAPTGLPVDGMAYTAGGTIDDGTVVSVGSSTIFTNTGLIPGMTYYYAVFAFNGSGALSNYLTVSPLTGSQKTNNPPGATAQTVAVNEDTDITITLAGSDADGDALTAIISTLPANGALYQTADGRVRGSQILSVPTTVTNTTKQVIYVSAPNGNGNGHGTFGFRMSDGLAVSPEVLITIDVTPVNDAPSFTKGANQTVLEDAGAQTVTGWATTITPGAPDEAGQVLTFVVTHDTPALFAVQPAVAANGTLSYTPAANANGMTTVTVTLQDNGGTASGGQNISLPQTFTITVTPVNDPPVAVNDAVGLPEMTSITIPVLANDTDVDGDRLTVESVTQGRNGSVVINADGTVTYTPSADVKEIDSFTYTVTDGHEGRATGTVTVDRVLSKTTATVVPAQVPVGVTEGRETYHQRLDITLRTGDLFTVQGRNTGAPDILLTVPSDVTVVEQSLEVTNSQYVTFTRVPGETGQVISLVMNYSANPVNPIQRKVVTVEFDVTTLATPAGGLGDKYYEILFRDALAFPFEDDILDARRPVVQVTNKRLSLVRFTKPVQDSTNAQGDSSSVVVDVLPDFQHGDFDPLRPLWYQTGVDTDDDVVFAYWMSTDSTLIRIANGNAQQMPDEATGQPAVDHERGRGRVVNVRGLPVGTYYVYVTSDETSSFVLGRSGSLVVRHQPVVNLAGWDYNTDSRLDVPGGDALDVTLDSGGYLDRDGGIDGSPVNSDNIDFRWDIVDYDNTAQIAIFRSTITGITKDSVLTTGTSPSLVVTGLKGATGIVDTLQEGRDQVFNFKIKKHGTIVEAGDDYLYFVVNDGKNVNLYQVTDRANPSHPLRIFVRHAPNLVPADFEQPTPNTGIDRFVTISWALGENDTDIDDNATISLYYSTLLMPPPIAFSTLQSEVAAGHVHVIATGIKEDPDRREDNQYMWDVWSYRDEQGRTVPEGTIFVYGVIADPMTSHVVRWGNTLTFIHEPSIFTLTPSNDISVTEGGSVRISWRDNYIGSASGGNAFIRVALVDASDPSRGTIPSYAGVENKPYAWIVNSDSGDGLGFSTPGTVLREEGALDYFEFFPDNTRYLRSTDGGANILQDGTYYVYTFIDADNNWASGAITSRAAGRIVIVGSRRNGTSPTPPLSPTEFTTGLGDTTLLHIRPNAQGAPVDLVSVFVTVDANYFTILDQDPVTAGVQPFTLEPGFRSSSVITNTMENVIPKRVGEAVNEQEKGIWQLNFVYYDPAGISYPNPVPGGPPVELEGKTTIATFQSACLGIQNGRVLSSLTLDDVGDRRTALYYKGGKIAQLSQTSTATIVPRARITGFIPLEGRSTYGKEVTFTLRPKGSAFSVTDATFAKENDQNSTKAGVQVELTENGGFALSQLPSGIYDLVVHADGYLDGQYASLLAHYGAVLGGINPTQNRDGLDEGKLLGGDVAGFIDASGANLPDNEVDVNDRNMIVAAFDARSGDGRYNASADVDGDGHVFLADLNMAAANDGKQGKGPVFKPVADNGDNVTVVFGMLDAITNARVGHIIEVPVVLRGGTGLRAYAVRVRYNPTLLQLVGTTEGDVLSGYKTVFVTTDFDGEVAIAKAIVGQRPGVSGEGTVARLRFEVLREGGHGLDLLEALVIDDTGRQMTAQVAAPKPQMLTTFRLLPNTPNPFNPTTSIRFALPSASEVTVTIYNILGERVTTLVNGRREAGSHTVVWDGRDAGGHQVASGVYVSRIVAGGFTAMQKMTLLK